MWRKIHNAGHSHEVYFECLLSDLLITIDVVALIEGVLGLAKYNLQGFKLFF